MLGLDSSGKTTILYKLHLGEVIALTPTIGFNIESVKYKKLTLTIWDVAGDQRTRRFWKTYYKGINGLIFVIDSEDRKSISTVKEEFYKICENEELTNVPVLVFANKQDLPNSMSACEIVEKLEMFKIRDRQWHLQASCALSGEGIEKGIDRLVQMAMRKKTDG